MGCFPDREKLVTALWDLAAEADCDRSLKMSVSANQGRWFRPRTLWLPTWRTLLLLAITIVPALIWTVAHLHSWLSVTEPVLEAKFLVVEGWVPDHVVKDAVDWSKDHEVAMFFTTGVPLEQGKYLSNYPSYAEICAATLTRLGADPTKVRTAPATKVDLERTRAMAFGLKHVLDSMNVAPGDRSINLFTSGCHAWRSRMHFQRVLGPDWKVGVVSVPPIGYVPGTWWKYSEGVKSVIEELVAILGQAFSS